MHHLLSHLAAKSAAPEAGRKRRALPNQAAGPAERRGLPSRAAGPVDPPRVATTTLRHFLCCLVLPRSFKPQQSSLARFSSMLAERIMTE